MTEEAQPPLRAPGFRARTARLGVIAGAALLVAGIAWLSHGPSRTGSVAQDEKMLAVSNGPPWTLGQPRARFALIAYADLECPYCRQYLPTLRQLIAEHPEANLQWRHLPLAEHEPAALQAARLAECAGEVGGGAGFWSTVEWLYRQPSRPNSAPADPISAPNMSPRVQTCLRSARPEAIIARDLAEAKRDQVSATPTLRLLDRESGRALILQGILAPDALLSAMDLLASPTSEIEAK